MTARRRCAVYTRKSTEEGLEQGFNSLHAQREACEAYIKSQKHEGWSCLPDGYDDGGISGGTMERPALRRLLADIKDAKIDVVVVYKVDRLTRSLADFAKMVEIFDAQEVSFVSVTQQFNTTTSMGRLTLNVLLSFAQFEREVTGERIRDKIAASKKKGLWMGGSVPLGYDAKDRELVVNPTEAETVGTLFRLYRELGTVRRLKQTADRLELTTKRRRHSSGQIIGGGPFTRGHLYQLLSNPIFVGEISHKGAVYPGRHHAIIDRETFDAVQRQLSGNASLRRSPTNAKASSLLTGLVCDETGDRLCPTHAGKKGCRYRYYISKRLMHGTGSTTDGWRLPARELDATVLKIVRGFLKDELQLMKGLQIEDCNPDRMRRLIALATTIGDELENGSLERQRQLICGIVHRITIRADSCAVDIARSGLVHLLASPNITTADSTDGVIPLVIPIQMRRRGIESKLVMQVTNGQSSPPDPKLITLLADAHRWIDDLAQGRAASIRDLARNNKRDAGEVSRTLPLAFLAPDIIDAVLEGRQPIGLTPRQLKRIGNLPARWDDQRRRLGSTPRTQPRS